MAHSYGCKARRELITANDAKCTSMIATGEWEGSMQRKLRAVNVKDTNKKARISLTSRWPERSAAVAVELANDQAAATGEAPASRKPCLISIFIQRGALRCTLKAS